MEWLKKLDQLLDSKESKEEISSLSNDEGPQMNDQVIYEVDRSATSHSATKKAPAENSIDDAIHMDTRSHEIKKKEEERNWDFNDDDFSDIELNGDDSGSLEKVNGFKMTDSTTTLTVLGTEAEFEDAKIMEVSDSEKYDDTTTMVEFETGEVSQKQENNINKQEKSNISDKDVEHLNILAAEPWKSFDGKLNCHGMIHVQISEVRHLPCAPGSTINANLSLHPWKGKIKTKKKETYGSKYQSNLKSGHNVTHPPCSHLKWGKQKLSSFLHAYNNEDTPLPILKVQVVLTSLQIIEKELVAFEIPCQPLISQPGVWVERWFTSSEHTLLSSINDKDRKKGGNESRRSFLLLKLCFELSSFDGWRRLSLDSINESGLESDGNRVPNFLQVLSDSNSIQSTNETQQSIDNSELQTIASSASNMTKSHLFQVQNSWVPPTQCPVCSKFLIAQRVYRCEMCNLDCCFECQLQSNIKFPCGLEITQRVVEKTIRHKISKLNIMSIVAPINEENTEARINNNGFAIDSTPLTFEKNKKEKLPKIVESNEIDIDDDDVSDIDMNELKTPGIGILKVRVVKGLILDKVVGSDTNINKLIQNDTTRSQKYGDFYVRIRTSHSEKSLRTRTVYHTSKPFFEEDLDPLQILHYGEEIRLDMVDATNGECVGTSVLSIQGILHRTQDELATSDIAKLCKNFNKSMHNQCNHDYYLELRTGAKNGFGLDFVNNAENISGWINVQVRFDEYDDIFRLREPRAVPSRPLEDFNIELIQLYIARLGAILKDVKSILTDMHYVISWENPFLTGLAMVIFVANCIKYNAEYALSVPFFIILLTMVYLGYRRRAGYFNLRWLEDERTSQVDIEKSLEVNYKCHRPLGTVFASIIQGRNIRSRELGLPGSFYVSLYYDPLRMLIDKERKVIADVDKASAKPIEVGFTWLSSITTNPIWDKISDSDLSKRLKRLLGETDLVTEDVELTRDELLDEYNNQEDDRLDRNQTQIFRFPILQPIRPVATSLTLDLKHISLITWESSPGAFLFQVRLDSLLNNPSGFEDCIGEVCVPLSKLMTVRSALPDSPQTFKLQGWFELQEVGSQKFVQLKDVRESSKSIDDETRLTEMGDKVEAGVAAVFLKIELKVPNGESSISKLDKEASIIVAEELIRANNVLSKGRGSVIGGSIEALNTIRSLGDNIQKTLGQVLDFVESVRNALYWANPQKSMLVFVIIFLLWLLLSMIPGRILVLFSGLVVFTFNFMKTFGYIAAPQNNEPPSILVFVKNFILSLPTNEDLRKFYFWESRRIGEQERKRLASQKRTLRLKTIWKAHWYGELDMKIEDSLSRYDSASQRNWMWQPIFGIIQGHQFIYWKTEKEFDNGELPLGSILFAGHAGLAGLSPLEVKLLRNDELQLVVNIFGRGKDGQQKLTLLMPSTEAKSGIEDAVIKVTCDNKRD